MKSEAMKDAVNRMRESVVEKAIADQLYNDDEMYEAAWTKAVQAGIDIANLIRAGEDVPEEMPDDPAVFLEAYPEGATVASIHEEQEATQ